MMIFCVCLSVCLSERVCVCVCAVMCMYLCLLHTEFQNFHSTGKVRTFLGSEELFLVLAISKACLRLELKPGFRFF